MHDVNFKVTFEMHINDEEQTSLTKEFTASGLGSTINSICEGIGYVEDGLYEAVERFMNDVRRQWECR